jgi:glyoxylase-like metal-dependent hydrolase (beta-lactamase superfamily II)
MDLVEVRGLRGIYLVDTGQFGLEGFGSAYILDGPIAAIVETGLSYSAPRILKALEELGIPTADVGYILATHVHLDHAGGAGPLAQACPNATVAVHERGAKHLIKPAYLVKSVREATGPMFHHYGEAVPIPRERLLELEGGEVISLGGGFKIRVLATPGHAPHHLCFFEERNRALFVGDAAGIYWPKADRLLPTTPPPSFDLELSLRSLELLQGLGAKQLLYTHFGPHDRPVAMLRDYSRLLRAWVEEILKLKRGHKSDEAIKQSLLEKYGPLLEGYYEPEMVAHEIGMNAEGVLQYLGSSGRASKSGSGPRS